MFEARITIMTEKVIERNAHTIERKASIGLASLLVYPNTRSGPTPKERVSGGHCTVDTSLPKSSSELARADQVVVCT